MKPTKRKLQDDDDDKQSASQEAQEYVLLMMKAAKARSRLQAAATQAIEAKRALKAAQDREASSAQHRQQAHSRLDSLTREFEHAQAKTQPWQSDPALVTAWLTTKDRAAQGDQKAQAQVQQARALLTRLDLITRDLLPKVSVSLALLVLLLVPSPLQQARSEEETVHAAFAAAQSERRTLADQAKQRTKQWEAERMSYSHLDHRMKKLKASLAASAGAVEALITAFSTTAAPLRISMKATKQ